MDGAAAVLGARRAAALAVLLVALVAYEAGARDLPGLPSGLDAAFQALVVFPAATACVWLALPLSRAGTKALLVLGTGAGALAIGFSVVDVDSVTNVAKLACYALLGFWFLTLFEELWWLALVAVLVPWVDIWSVAAGPTEYVVEERPGVFAQVAIGFPSPGETATVNLGPPDVVFFALFLAAAERFQLRVVATWIGMTGCLAATLVLVWSWESVAGLPALPAVCLGFLVPNADLLWRDVQRMRSRSSESG